ncbi:hypothetical protein ACFP9V_18920 [Deinococcus radiopugnans]|uniref:hypothetical protein n=1 Tax=Deinococcus radiopugnans TaxID=57497 RepID=UPI0036182B59
MSALGDVRRRCLSGAVSSAPSGNSRRTLGVFTSSRGARRTVARLPEWGRMVGGR